MNLIIDVVDKAMSTVYDKVKSRINSLIREWESAYVDRTRRSKELYERARNLMPAGVTYSIRYMRPYPLYIDRAEGTRAWDVDSNEYIDLWMGHGAHVLGHSPKVVKEAVIDLLSNKPGSWHLGYENPYAILWAELISKVTGMDMVRHCISGTEANMYALRLARAFTRRKYVVKVEGGWHGGLDQLHIAVNNFRGVESAGLPEEFTKYTIVVPYNDLNEAEAALKRYPVAAILIEPVTGVGGCLPAERDYLKGLRELAYQYGSLLILDEVITGFRLAPGGAQEFFKVKGDLVVYGKAVGGGFPGSGAVAGIAEIMELYDHIKYPDPSMRAFHGGTFTGNPINMIAGYALIKYLSEHRELYDQANNLWEGVRRDIDKVCEENDRICWVVGVGNMSGIHFTRVRPRNVREVYELRWSEEVVYAHHLFMRLKGILYMSERNIHFLPSLIHKEDEAKSLLSSFTEFLSMITRG